MRLQWWPTLIRSESDYEVSIACLSRMPLLHPFQFCNLQSRYVIELVTMHSQLHGVNQCYEELHQKKKLARLHRESNHIGTVGFLIIMWLLWNWSGTQTLLSCIWFQNYGFPMCVCVCFFFLCQHNTFFEAVAISILRSLTERLSFSQMQWGGTVTDQRFYLFWNISLETNELMRQRCKTCGPPDGVGCQPPASLIIGHAGWDCQKL